MKKYNHYRAAADFAQDEDFIRWVKSDGTNDALNRQWVKWLTQHPDMREVVDEARAMVQAVLTEKQHSLSENKKQEMWQHISLAIDNTQPLQPPVVKNKTNKYSAWYSIAAAIAMLLFAGIFAYLYYPSSALTRADIPASIPINKNLTCYKNRSTIPQTLQLSDGSRVTLQPNSTLAYPKTFSEHKRQVYLSGEGFFDITKDARKPFFVYANEIVTQVLGTSFTVRAYEQERNISVVVKTGKVSVYTLSKEVNGSDQDNIPVFPALNGTLLLPNQQVVFSRDLASMIKSLVAEPVVLPAAPVHEFNYIDTPISEVFTQLEQMYGVDIVYDDEAMVNCFLNASLNDLSFHDKLRLICKGINARYEILDAHVIITGSGCQ
ncbi:MAG TPA: FecR family protein [Ohtaekwangia sp.]|uniref:FecR family protein n=1 Tax=Ohtaekwangia sp. TaxID=2066019 RepID=UPI002F9203F2